MGGGLATKEQIALAIFLLFGQSSPNYFVECVLAKNDGWDLSIPFLSNSNALSTEVSIPHVPYLNPQRLNL